MKKTIIFDFDGTLADSLDLGVNIIQTHTSEFLDKQLSKKEMKKIIREKGLYYILKQYNIQKWKLPFLVWRFRKDFKKGVQHSKPFPEAKKTLLNLSRKGYIIIIFSTNSKKNISIFLRNHSFNSYITKIYSSLFLLDKDKTLKKIIKAENIDLKKSFYVGDESRDIIACKKVGLKCIVVNYGFNSEKLLKKEKPYRIISKVSDLLKLV